MISPIEFSYQQHSDPGLQSNLSQEGLITPWCLAPAYYRVNGTRLRNHWCGRRCRWRAARRRGSSLYLLNCVSVHVMFFSDNFQLKNRHLPKVLCRYYYTHLRHPAYFWSAYLTTFLVSVSATSHHLHHHFKDLSANDLVKDTAEDALEDAMVLCLLGA